MTRNTMTFRITRSILILLLIWMLPGNIISAQDIDEFREYEDTLVRLSEVIYMGENEQGKYQSNEVFIELFEDALSLNNSFRYPFDSLKLVKIIIAPDRKFRIITWMLAKDDGTYEYFGFIQSFSRRKDDYEVYLLTDMSETMESPETKVLDHKNWYGAVYYDIILTRHGGNRYYTLLGWDGNNPLIRRKIIEVVTLRSNGMPRFGQSLFKYDKPHSKRIFFEYSTLTSMNLRFDMQQYFIKKKRIFYREEKNPYQQEKKRKKNMGKGISSLLGRSPTGQPKKKNPYRMAKKKEEMIIFDRLVPMDTILEGQYQFYVPEGNIVDALRFSGGKWRYTDDIDARNRPQPFDNPKKRPKALQGL